MLPRDYGDWILCDPHNSSARFSCSEKVPPLSTPVFHFDRSSYNVLTTIRRGICCSTPEKGSSNHFRASG